MSEDNKNAPLLKNMRLFLEFLSKNPAKLTQTKNLNLKWLNELSNVIEFPEYFKKYKILLRSQTEWREVDMVAVLAEVARFTTNRKNKKTITKYGREFLQKNIEDQTDWLFDVYWNRLNWRYIFPNGGDINAACQLQKDRDYAMSLMFEKDKKNNEGQIDFMEFAEQLRASLGLTLINYFGQNLPHRVRDCVRQVIVEMFEKLGIIECFHETKTEMLNGREWKQTELKSFKFTSEGRRSLKAYKCDDSTGEIMPFNTKFMWN